MASLILVKPRGGREAKVDRTAIAAGGLDRMTLTQWLEGRTLTLIFLAAAATAIVAACSGTNIPPGTTTPLSASSSQSANLPPPDVSTLLTAGTATSEHAAATSTPSPERTAELPVRALARTLPAETSVPPEAPPAAAGQSPKEKDATPHPPATEAAPPALQPERQEPPDLEPLAPSTIPAAAHKDGKYIRLARQVLAKELALTSDQQDQLALQSVTPVTWSDGSMGCAHDGYVYTKATVPGYLLRFNLQDRPIRVHASERGRIFAALDCDSYSDGYPRTVSPAGPDWTGQIQASQGIGDSKPQTGPLPEEAQWCPEGDSQGERLNDLAEHVYDGAVSRYLLTNASDIGREITPDSETHALLLLVNDQAHDQCVTLPERCLRAEFRLATANEQRDALLRTRAAYAYQRALACLKRAGDSYAARATAPELPEDLEERYQERILPRLVGNMMPVATLVDSTAYGTNNHDRYRLALRVWQDCYQTLSQEAVRPGHLAERISQDKLAVLDCVEELHIKIPRIEENPAPAPETAGPNPSGFSPTLPGDDWNQAIARNRSGGELFSLMLPPGWELKTAHGIDSNIGEIRGDGVLLRFDLGWYSHEPRPERDPLNEYIVLHEDIGGSTAKLVLAAVPPTEKGENHRAVTAVYFGDLQENNRLIIAGEGLTQEQQKKAIAIFRTIRMADQGEAK